MCVLLASHFTGIPPMPIKTARLTILLALFMPLASAALAASDESKSESIGPWEIEATFKGDAFDRCAISRKLDNDIVARFIRTKDDLTFMLESPNWKLERGKNYAVKMNLGPQSWDTEVAAEANSVTVGVDQKKFEAGLKSANALNVVAAGATIRVPLDKSSLALSRLQQCVEKNMEAVESNPFVAPPRRP
jgi:hypothetical protein